MTKPQDLTGRKFHHLTVLGFRHADRHGSHHWLCECCCGRTIMGTSKYLKSGHIKSCGCVEPRIRRIVAEVYPELGSQGVVYRIHQEFGVIYTTKQIIALAHTMGVPTDQRAARRRARELDPAVQEKRREAAWWRSMMAIMPVTPIRFIPENKRFDGRKV